MENAEKDFPYKGKLYYRYNNKELVERIIPEIEQVISVPVKNIV